MAVPNQRIIYIKRDSDNAKKNFFKIGHKQLEKAANDLKGNAFKLYIYLANNKNNYKLELSSKHYIQWSGSSDGTYDRAFKELKDKGYLEPAKEHKNVFLFVEESKTYNDRHKDDKIIVSDEEEIEQLFGLKGDLF